MSRKINSKNAIAVFCATILVGTEILAAALALGWAIGGLTGWGEEFTYAVLGGCFVGGAYLIWHFLRGAMQVEPIFEVEPSPKKERN